MAPTRDSGRRLSADDWIQAGFALLADSGPNALRVDRLCERLHVTKGSFYWHFTDVAAYRDEVVNAWGSLHDQQRRQFESVQHIEPRQRLAVMMRALADPEHWALERAMRGWALSDESVLASVQRSEDKVQAAIRQAFADYGFGPEDAALRASVMYAMGIGLLHSSDTSPEVPPQLAERFLDFILHR